MKAPIYKGESKAFQKQQDKYWAERNPKKKIAKKMGGHEKYKKTLSREGQIKLREKVTSKNGRDIYGRDIK